MQSSQLKMAVRESRASVRPDVDLLQRATRYLLNNLELNLSGMALSCLLGVREDDLSHVFQDSLGLTIAGYQEQERMRLAQRLLAQTSLSLDVIARRTGHPNGAIFSKAFREYTGLTPWTFRSDPPPEFVTSVQGSLLWG